MGDYSGKRPAKKIFPKEMMEFIRNKAIDRIKSELLPDEKIIKILLIGSSVKDSFGKYDPPGFRGSLFSDFDFIVFVEDDYEVPHWLAKEPSGKPFPINELNLSYRQKNFVENKYDAEIFFIRKSSMRDSRVLELGEKAGIPMNADSKHKNLVVYSKFSRRKR